jgi:hypothetical protein
MLIIFCDFGREYADFRIHVIPTYLRFETTERLVGIRDIDYLMGVRR